MAINRPALAIPQTDPRAGYLAQRTAIDAAIARVLAGGVYILGREVEVFEAAFADSMGVAHAIGVASGTDAIEIALRACGIGSGDLVFTVSHTAVATIAAIERAGATPVLVDVEPQTYTMAPRELLRVLQSPPAGRPAAVLPVHIYGQPAELSALTEIARKSGMRLIEDCAQSHGALYRGRAAGSYGDIACFSFYPTKNLGALGDGGMVVTNDPLLGVALREIREYGWRERYVSARSGINSRLDPIQAAILGVKLRSLQAAGIGSGIHYPVPVHQQPAYSGRLACGPSGLGVTERAATQILSLPIYPQISDEAVDRVIAEIRSFFA